MIIIQFLLIIEFIYLLFLSYKEPSILEEKTFNYTRNCFFTSVISISLLTILPRYDFSEMGNKLIPISLIIVSIAFCIKSVSALLDTVKIHNQKNKKA